MKASPANIRHHAEGTMYLLLWEDPGNPASPQTRRVAIKHDGELHTLPITDEEYRSTPSRYQDPANWTTQLLGDRHSILNVYPPEGIWDRRVPTSADAGLVVRGTSHYDTAVATTIRFVLHEVANGFARVEGGGSHRLTDYTWDVDVNSRKPSYRPRPTHLTALARGAWNETFTADDAREENAEYLRAQVELIMAAEGRDASNEDTISEIEQDIFADVDSDEVPDLTDA